MECIFSTSTPLILQARQISCNIHGIKSMEASKLFHRIDHSQRHSYRRDNCFISLSSFSRGNLLSCKKNNARILIVEAFTSNIPSPHNDNNIKQNHWIFRNITLTLTLQYYPRATILPDAWDMLERSPRIVRGRQSCSPTYWATPRTVTIACTQSTLEGYSGDFARTLDIWITSEVACRTSHLCAFATHHDSSIVQ